MTEIRDILNQLEKDFPKMDTVFVYYKLMYSYTAVPENMKFKNDIDWLENFIKEETMTAEQEESVRKVIDYLNMRLVTKVLTGEKSSNEY